MSNVQHDDSIEMRGILRTDSSCYNIPRYCFGFVNRVAVLQPGKWPEREEIKQGSVKRGGEAGEEMS